MRVLIVDGDRAARERLGDLVQQHGVCTLLHLAGDADEALRLLEREDADLVLLEARLPDSDGLQLVRWIKEREPAPAVIFVTAHPEHALKAWDVGADGFLLKPVAPERLRRALRRASRTSRLQLPEPAAEVTSQGIEHLSIATREGIARIPVGRILYFKAEHKYTTVRHLQGEALTDASLSTLERQMGPRFLRIHRKLLVALRYIEALERDPADEEQFQLRLRAHGPALPVARRRLPEVRRLLEGSLPT